MTSKFVFRILLSKSFAFLAILKAKDFQWLLLVMRAEQNVAGFFNDLIMVISDRLLCTNSCTHERTQRLEGGAKKAGLRRFALCFWT